MNIKYILRQLELYECNPEENIKCKKTNCSKYYCTQTTQYRYAKKTFINFAKKIINKLRGRYTYE